MIFSGSVCNGKSSQKGAFWSNQSAACINCSRLPTSPFNFQGFIFSKFEVFSSAVKLYLCEDSSGFYCSAASTSEWKYSSPSSPVKSRLKYLCVLSRPLRTVVKPSKITDYQTCAGWYSILFRSGVFDYRVLAQILLDGKSAGMFTLSAQAAPIYMFSAALMLLLCVKCNKMRTSAAEPVWTVLKSLFGVWPIVCLQ